MKSGKSMFKKALGRLRRFFICGARSRMTCVSCAGVAVAGESERGTGRGTDALRYVGEEAHVFRNRLEQLRRRRGQEYLKLQALNLVGEGFGGHIDIGGESEKR